MGETLTPGVIARLVTSEQGSLKGIPETARACLLITRVTPERREVVLELARLVCESARITSTLYSEEAGAWF